MPKRRILVTGGSGTVGSYISAAFPNDSVFLPAKSILDVSQKKQIQAHFAEVRPHVVIHLAAKTNVDECERNSLESHQVNSLGTQYIAELCAQYNSTLIYSSSAAVFDGKKSFFTEDDQPSPINIYGKTKLLGEQAIQNLQTDHIIIRAGWIVGGGAKEKKFISYLLQQVRDGAQEISVIHDTLGTLTSAQELVEYMKILLTNDLRGCFHFGSSGVCSRFDIAQKVVDILNLNVTIIPVPSSHFADRFFAPRPTHEVIRSSKKTPYHLRTWQESLTTYINTELRDV